MGQNRTEAMNQYRTALRSGQKYFNNCVAQGQYPYPQVLEEIYTESMAAARVDMGTIDIPMDNIVGTLAAGRKAAFAGNFMPLLPPETEFGTKWVSLCEAHLGTEGITDPITCYEYLGKFYVQEGHKRVSVLRSFGAPTIAASVTRIMPTWSEDPVIQAYGEFIAFYQLTRIYQVQFTRPGAYDKLLRALGCEEGHVWSQEERVDFLSMYGHFREVCDDQILSAVRDHSVSEVVLSCLEVYPYAELMNTSGAELKKQIMAILPDMRLATGQATLPVSTAPQEIPDKSVVERIWDGLTRTTLFVAMIYANSPEESAWTRGHDLGRQEMEETLKDAVRVRTYIASTPQADETMAQAVAEGAQVLIVTAPTLMGAARRVAATNPNLKVLVCALSVPYAGIRTYYSRIYETKFISGAIAGSLCNGEPIGYVARYPILGVPASINAFALGARMTCPDAKVLLTWSCLPGNPVAALRSAGARMISGHPIAAQDLPEDGIGWSTSRINADGAFEPISSDVWEWGKMYVRILRGIIGGTWNNEEGGLHYWWGIDSGVIDLKLADSLPNGTVQLAGILREGIINGTIQPLNTRMRDQDGVLRNDGKTLFSSNELMRMNWLLENVEGHIPTLEEMLPMSRETTRLLALNPDEPGERAAK